MSTAWKGRLLILGASVFVVVFGFMLHSVGASPPLSDPRCYETPSAADVGHTLSPPVHAYGGLFICGLYSRTALPDVIRCYELNKGCSP